MARKPAVPDDTRDPEITWATLRDAAARANVSVSALRKWYRNGTIRSEMADGPHGEQRLVALEDVIERAARFAAMRRPDDIVVDAELVDDVGTPQSMAVATRAVVSGRGMLIPRDAWAQAMAVLDGIPELWHDHADRLDRLHQALAEAMARAASAEAKAASVDGRLEELRRAEEERAAALAAAVARAEQLREELAEVRGRLEQAASPGVHVVRRSKTG